MAGVEKVAHRIDIAQRQWQPTLFTGLVKRKFDRDLHGACRVDFVAFFDQLVEHTQLQHHVEIGGFTEMGHQAAIGQIKIAFGAGAANAVHEAGIR